MTRKPASGTPLPRRFRGPWKEVWFVPVLLTLALLAVGAATHQRVRSERRVKQQKELEADLQALRETVRLRLRGTEDYLSQLALERARGTLDPAAFQKRAGAYLEAHRELINITWVDAGYVIRAVAPEAGNQQILGLTLALREPERASHFAAARRRPVYTAPFEAIQGRPSFEVWVPVHKGDTFLGLLAGVYSCERMLQEALPSSMRARHAELRSGSGGVLGRVAGNAPVDRSLATELPLGLPDQDLDLHLRLQGAAPGEGSAWNLLLEGASAALALGMGWGMWALRVDVRRRKQSERALQESERRFRELLEGVRQVAVILDEDGNISFCNDYLLILTRWERSDVAGRSWFEIFIPADQRTQVRQLFLDGLRTERVVPRYENPILTRSGDRRLISWNNTVLRGPDGRPSGIASLGVDTTEQRRAETALREALAFNRQIISCAQEGILVFNAEGRLVLLNPFLEELSGIASKDLLGLGPEELFKFVESSGMAEGVRKALAGESLSTPSFPWAFPATGRSGWATSTLAPLADPEGAITGVIATLTDVTALHQAEAERVRLEAELQQNQKLESLGGLASGVAHDMNNVLAAIQAVVQTLGARQGQEASLAASLELIEKATVRGRDLVKGLTHFARRDLDGAEVLDLNQLVREEMELLRRTTLQRLDLHLDLEEPLPAVEGERGTLGSALMNLCVNAVDAMPEGGRLTLRTRRLPENQVELAVEDTGPGMSPAVAARAFEPFFTTKPQGKGTGLGLSMVYAAAKAHGGAVSLQSEEGKGTTVSLRLPATFRQEAGAAPAPSSTAPALRILLVDDDDLVRAAIPPLLELHGHRVQAAPGGAEGLALLEAGLQVDLVLLDLNMPGMNGLETLRRLRALRPELPVLLATGYLDTDTAEILALDPQVMTLTKPFQFEELNILILDLATPSAPNPPAPQAPQANTL